MKKYCLLFLYINLIAFYTQAQEKPETTKLRNWLTETVKEKFDVLKSDKKTKEGLYEAIYTPSGAIIARGNYHDNKHVGLWHYFDLRQRLIETFDYSRNMLFSEEPISIVTRVFIGYAFDVKLADSDKITKPIRIGGRCFGYIPYLQLFHLSIDYKDVDTYQLAARLEMLISPGGRLADLKVHIIFLPDNSERITTINPNIFSDADRQFIPATVNGEPVMSRIFLRCRVTESGALDVN